MRRPKGPICFASLRIARLFRHQQNNSSNNNNNNKNCDDKRTRTRTRTSTSTSSLARRDYHPWQYYYSNAPDCARASSELLAFRRSALSALVVRALLLLLLLLLPLLLLLLLLLARGDGRAIASIRSCRPMKTTEMTKLRPARISSAQRVAPTKLVRASPQRRPPDSRGGAAGCSSAASLDKPLRLVVSMRTVQRTRTRASAPRAAAADSRARKSII